RSCRARPATGADRSVDGLVPEEQEIITGERVFREREEGRVAGMNRIRYRLTSLPFFRDREHVVRNEYYLRLRRHLALSAAEAWRRSRVCDLWHRIDLWPCGCGRVRRVRRPMYHPAAAAYWLERGYAVQLATGGKP